MRRRIYRHLETKELWEVRFAGECLMLLSMKRGIRFVKLTEYPNFEFVHAL
jgi:hypothetical protein